MNDQEQGLPAGGGGRYRVHREPARNRTVKVLYAEDELGAVQLAAAQAGLRPSSFVGAAALAMATGGKAPVGAGQDREVLAELLQARLAVRQYGTNINQVAAALNAQGTPPPVWLVAAVAGAERTLDRLDQAAAQLSRRLV